jgi:hypothetical protein
VHRHADDIARRDTQVGDMRRATLNERVELAVGDGARTLDQGRVVGLAPRMVR